MDEEVQVTAFRMPTDAPLMFTATLPAEEVLVMVRIPVNGPPFTDVNDRVRVAA